jgi:hypothetical protein
MSLRRMRSDLAQAVGLGNREPLIEQGGINRSSREDLLPMSRELLCHVSWVVE